MDLFLASITCNTFDLLPCYSCRWTIVMQLVIVLCKSVSVDFHVIYAWLIRWFVGNFSNVLCMCVRYNKRMCSTDYNCYMNDDYLWIQRACFQINEITNRSAIRKTDQGTFRNTNRKENLTSDKLKCVVVLNADYQSNQT